MIEKGCNSKKIHVIKSHIDINRFKLPLDNKGVLADVVADVSGPAGKFDEGIVLFSAGFSVKTSAAYSAYSRYLLSDNHFINNYIHRF